MARSKFQMSGSGDDDVNVTPLLDIVFIMLIFFIVTSTFVKEPGVDVLRPEARTAEQQKLASILVAVTADDQVWVNRREVGVDGVKTAVEELRRENPKGTAVVQADAGSKARFLVEVVNQIRAAGVNEIAVSTEEA